MRVLVCEAWDFPWYGEVLLQRLCELGLEAHGFKMGRYLAAGSGHGFSALGVAWRRLQRKYLVGPSVRALNAALIQRVHKLKPDVLLIWHGNFLFPETLRTLKGGGLLIAGYENDNPFSASQPRYRWRHLIAGLRFYDHYFVYRHSNTADFKAHCRSVELLRSWYVREVHRPLQEVGNSPYLCDVSFIGHWEDDGRENYIQALLDNSAIRFRLHGGDYWKRAGNHKNIEDRCGSIRPVYNEEYNLVLNSSKIALVFLSKLNSDTYTRRNFEIPAAGTFMLSERTEDLEGMFKAGMEADYFQSKEEMMSKTAYYLKQEGLRKAIAKAGRARLLRDGHEVLDRARIVARAFAEMVSNERLRSRIQSGR